MEGLGNKETDSGRRHGPVGALEVRVMVVGISPEGIMRPPGSSNALQYCPCVLDALAVSHFPAGLRLQGLFGVPK